MPLSVENVLNALSLVIEPDLKKDLVSLGMIRDVKIEGKKVSFTVILTTPACPLKESIKKACIQAIHDHVDKEADVDVLMEARVTGKSVNQEPMLPGVKNIIAIASGKGGVGKSTLAANLAIALAKSGAKVGLVDADIYGPSVPLMFDAVNQELQAVELNGKTKVLPLEKYGISVISIGFFVDASKALIWRGPMASAALKQLFTDVQWGELDYMLIDLPPGTGDIHLTLVQSVKLCGAVIVSTPQEVALTDARKAVSMFENNNIKVKVLGLVENMAWFTPLELPDSKYYIFGKDGGKELAGQMQVPFLGQVPLIQGVRESGDLGKPAAMDDNHPASSYFEEIAGNLAREVSVENARKEQLLDLIHK
jgi:ATP-binding protein involved in chromosome partitioning